VLKFKWETSLQETEFGNVSKEWKGGVVKDVAKVNELYIKSGFKENRIEYIDITSVQNGELLGFQDLSLSDAPSRAKRVVRENDILISTVRPSLKHFAFVKKAKSNTIASTGFAVVTPIKISPRYLYYVLTSEPITTYLSQIAETQTSAYPAFNPCVIGDIHVALPLDCGKPIGEDTRIGSILAWFDDLIENKKRQNEILEKTSMAIFKNWFIDLEPFRDVEFESSKLGEIPKGWEIKPIGELAEVRNGLSYSGKEKFEEPVDGSCLFITLNNAVEGGGFKPVYAWIKSDRIKEHHLLEEGDLIIPNTEQTKDERLVGSPGIVFFPPDYEGKKGVYSHHITKILPFEQKLGLFLHLFLRFTREDSASFATGTGVLGMDVHNFKKNKLVIVPSRPVLEKFHSLVKPLFQRTITNQKEIMVLRKIRNTLLPLLVFGKLRVEVA
jgi:type I restriction enzyme S subunit